MSGLLFVFDMDDVLYRYDFLSRMASLTELTGLDLAEMRRRWWHADGGEISAEAGAYPDPDDYLAAFSAALGTPISEAEWVRIRGGAMTPDAGAITAARRASELGRVTLLTNNGPVTMRNLRTLAPALVDVFGDHLFTSSHYGARKPDPVVFERVLAAYAQDAADTFFADDLAENVAGAESLGITGHVYTTPERLLAAIEEFAAARS